LAGKVAAAAGAGWGFTQQHQQQELGLQGCSGVLLLLLLLEGRLAVLLRS
jgi:hypothetical protein